MNSYADLKTNPAVPQAASMIETFRAMGYTIETAVADIVDNSVAAGAHQVWIDYDYPEGEMWLSVRDDGHGMDNDTLINAMVPGSKDPALMREKNDLGRFGVGLKAASFSQAKVLTVASKMKNTGLEYWTWDLDYVREKNRWELVKYIPARFAPDPLCGMEEGTVVIWSHIDRLNCRNIRDDVQVLKHYNETMVRVQRHLSMVFHRFISRKKLAIYCNGQELEAWDPFLVNEPATQQKAETPLEGGQVKMQGYILPHKSRMSSPEVWENAAGIKGWNAQQGFYIYRNDRLLMTGDWLGFFQKDEHTKLARISVDLDNSMDKEWQIDIRKSVAIPPAPLVKFMKSYAGVVREEAKNVYNTQGNTDLAPRSFKEKKMKHEFQHLWSKEVRGDKWFLKINREHDFIKVIKEQARINPDKAIDCLLKFLEQTIPGKTVFAEEAENPESQAAPFEVVGDEKLKIGITYLYRKFCAQGESREEAADHIKCLYPFVLFKGLVDAVTEEL